MFVLFLFLFGGFVAKLKKKPLPSFRKMERIGWRDTSILHGGSILQWTTAMWQTHKIVLCRLQTTKAYVSLTLSTNCSA